MSRITLRTATFVFAASVGLLSSGCTQSEPPAGSSAPAVAASDAAAATAAPQPAGAHPDAAGAEPRGVGVPPTSAAVTQGRPGIVLRPAAEAQAAAVAPPVSLDIEGTDIDVKVIDVGIDDDEMEIPRSFYEAGWYRYGPAPGAPAGHAVLAAHIDIGTEEMPFARLKDVPIGTIVTVGREDADPVRYRVSDVQNQRKASLDTEELFRRDGDHELVIVTCGGSWLADSEDYEDNVILTATPL